MPDKATSRRRRLRRLAIAGAVVAGLLVVGVALNTIGTYRGWTVERVPPEILSSELSPFYRVFRPAGAGPYPTALLYSGCDGPHDNMERWANALVADGWAAIVVDSHAPRGLDDLEAWRLVCLGQVLSGAERAGDVLVSLADARAMPFVDPDRMALIGMSHGGWSIMDLLALDAGGELPLNLDRGPGSADDPPLSGVAAVVLVYPWCGPTNRAVGAGWQLDTPVLFVLADDDMIAPAEDCRAVAQTLTEMGRPVEMESFAGVTHGFDQEVRAVPSTLVFDAEATAATLHRALGFLDAAIGRPSVSLPAGVGN